MTDFMSILDSIASKRVDLFIDWELIRNHTNIIAGSRSIGGREQSFLWGNFKSYSVPVSYVPSSDASLVNELWRDSDTITVNLTALGIDPATFNGFIVNRAQPFSQLQKPYQDLWQGTVEIEQL